MALGAACAAACLVLERMTRAAMERNGVLAAVTLAYFTRVHSPEFPFRLRRRALLPPRELVVGLIFTVACLLPIFSAALAVRHEPAVGLWTAAMFFVLVTWLNAYAIRCWESETPSRVRVCGCLLGGAGLFCALAISHVDGRMGLLIAMGCVSALLLSMLDVLRARMTPLTLRACADLVLLAPVALLLR